MQKIITTKNVIIALAIIALVIITPMAAKKSIAEEIIKKFEGLRLNAYLDSGGVPTIGWGSITNLDLNRPVQMGDKIDEPTAYRWLRLEIASKRDGVKKLVKVPINQNQ